MFTHYKPVESTEQLPVGNYEAKIVKVEHKQSERGVEYLNVRFEIKDHLGAVPDRATIFAEPKDAKYLESYNRDLTLFFDTFGIERGNLNWDEWVGHTGTVTVYPKDDGSGYNTISHFPLTEKRLQNKIKKAEVARSPCLLNHLIECLLCSCPVRERKNNLEAQGFQTAPQVPQGQQGDSGNVLPGFPEDIPY